MIHIAPWAATIGLVRGAAEVVPLGGLLYVYGAFRRDGRHTAPSNDAFDRDLSTRDAGDVWRPFGSIGAGLERADLAAKEWIGLVAYRLTGRSSALFLRPAP